MSGEETSRARRERIVQAIVEHTGVDQVMIRALVHAFYGRVRRDPELGPIFEVAIDDWDAHLEKLCDFWSSVMLMSGRYKGNPMLAHMQLEAIRPEHFERWLALFRETAAEICPGEAAEAFVLRAENIAKSLRTGISSRPCE
jgi:hemoglobin